MSTPSTPSADGAFCDGAPETNDFPDVTDADPGNEAISCLTADELNIVRGFADGTYRPNAATARRQMALFLQRLADNAKELEAPGEDLPELPEYDGAEPLHPTLDDEKAEVIEAINRLADAGIVLGTTGHHLQPRLLRSLAARCCSSSLGSSSS
jgi:hypothetical protein